MTDATVPNPNEAFQTTNPGQPSRYAKQVCRLSVAETIGQALIWIILSFVTLGFALFFYFYYAQRLALSRTEIVDQTGRIIGKLTCELTFGQVLGHAILWILLTIVTLGLASLIFCQRAYAYVLSQTKVELF